MEKKDLSGANAEKEYEERNVMLEDDPVSEEEIRDTILEDSDLSAFQKTVARMDDGRFLRLQRLIGVALGILTAVALFWGELTGNMEASKYSLIAAVCLALLVPNILEKKMGRKINSARTAMALTLLALLMAFFIYTGVRTGFSFKA